MNQTQITDNTSSDSKLKKQREQVELHVLVASQLSWKPEAWQAVDRGSASSVGFIKVSGDRSLAEVRPVIQNQIRGDSIPTQYVFLKQVGRGSTVCSPQQERSLRAKDFAYPHGEICILSSANMVFHSRDQSNTIPVISVTEPGGSRRSRRRDRSPRPLGVKPPASPRGRDRSPRPLGVKPPWRAPSPNPVGVKPPASPNRRRDPSRRRDQSPNPGVKPPASSGGRKLNDSKTAPMAPIGTMERSKSPSFRSLRGSDTARRDSSSYSMFQDNELMMAEIAFLDAKRALAEAHANALRNQYMLNQSVIMENETDTEDERQKQEEEQRKHEEQRKEEDRKRKQEELRKKKDEELRKKKEEELKKMREEEQKIKREEEQHKRNAEAKERERIRREEEAERTHKLGIEEEKRRKKQEREERERKIEEQLQAEDEKQRALRDLKKKAAEKRRQEEEDRIAQLERAAREEEEERRRKKIEDEERAKLADEMFNKEKKKLHERAPKKYTKEELEEVAMLRAKIVTYRGQRKDLESKHHDLLQRLADMELNWNDEDNSGYESKWRPKCKEEEVKTPQLYERNRQLRLELQMLYRQADTVITHAQAMKQNDDRKGMAFPSIKNNLRINLQRMEHEVNALKKGVATANIKYEAEKANREGVEKEVKQLRQELISSKISSSASKL